MQPILNDILARRRDRSIAIILGLKERECDQHLPRDASSKLRKAILDQFNEYHDLVMDVCRSLDTGEVTINEVYLTRMEQKLDQIRDYLEASDASEQIDGKRQPV